ncbi:histidine--tRNA ligase [uncultured Pseudokineococcus sp.]|uniref:histidine--tRNA ligase n=1 Tax=uncultured Pseudokineococcus sp. TaxID=1642928 RepID=UPI002638B916|nr:histidine--tRNA ligase [uncultured Pseudokineococcus sp.]
MAARTPRPLSGFPELLPGERVVEEHVLDVLREVFELHGFAGVETRAVEPLSVLLRKGEIDKEVYAVRRLAEVAEDGATDGGATDDVLALHYDLTVPFARYVLENAGKLSFPFRRYQIQKVWRGERPQEGRFREFRQADVDVVDAGSLAPHHEAELPQVMADVFARLPLPPVVMQVNNRRLVEGFYRGLGLDDPAAVMREVDKLDKSTPARVRASLVDGVGVGEREADACLALATLTGAPGRTDFVEQVRGLGVRDELLDQGLDELAAVVAGTRAVGGDDERFRVVADLSITRGLDYYTGTVYEARMTGFEHLGSVCSGGRYDALADDGRTTYPGVGLSLGVTRTLLPLLQRGLLRASRPTPTAVLVAVTDEEHRAASSAAASALRARGVATEVAPSAARFGKQIRFADRRSIPFVWFVQEDGTSEVKDIRSGEQVVADPTTWLPPAEDARPRVSWTDEPTA